MAEAAADVATNPGGVVNIEAAGASAPAVGSMERRCRPTTRRDAGSLSRSRGKRISSLSRSKRISGARHIRAELDTNTNE